MTKDEARRRIANTGIVPVIRASSSAQAMRAAEAICAGGIPVIEITMTVPGAIDLIGQLARGMDSQILIGAGTVPDAITAERCIDAGAQFIVSPGFNPNVVDVALARNVLVMAGALTPTEIIAAWQAGSDLVKIFPCGAVGGAKYIKALKGPLPHIPMVPTGGVNLAAVADFIHAGAEALGVGGELLSASALASGDLQEITQSARKFVSAVHDARRGKANGD
jgi:2-dehydro-3-deoxyphosphogluconate aldolase / (4S)-4-hydroxy-2-oxoglutarate aldolase